jgi:exopolysaccharide production protein ExoZ
MGKRSGGLYKRLKEVYETDRSGGRVLAMEGLRGLAILLVFLCHYKLVVLDRLGPVFGSTFFKTTVQIGGTGVDLFFLLSGLLIYKAALRRDLHLGRFLARRIRRIYPTFLVAFSIYLFVSVLLHQGPRRVPNSAAGGATYIVQNILLLPGIADIQPLIPAAWSLSYEISFYLAIPIVVQLLRMSLWSRLHRCLFWTSLLWLHLLCVLLLGRKLPVYHYQSNDYLRFGMFLAGMLTFEVLDSASGSIWLTIKRQRWLSLLGSVTGLAYILIVIHFAGVEDAPPSYAAAKAALIFITYTSLALGTLCENGIWKNVFSNVWLRWTGNISYSVYLIHGIVLNMVIAVLLHESAVRAHPLVSAVILFPVSIVVTLAISTALFVLIEKPLSLQPAKRVRVSEEQHAASVA